MTSQVPQSFTIGTTKVDPVSADSKNWYSTKEDKYRPDKDKFILDKFKRDYASIKVVDSTQLYALCSRSSILGEWLAGANFEYAKVEDIPTFFKDKVDANEFQSAIGSIQKISDFEVARAKEKLVLAAKYKYDMNEIDAKYNHEIALAKTSNLIKVLTMPSTAMPITLQLAIENYTPGTAAGSPTQKAYAREMLINYKRSLIDICNGKKGDINFDIFSIIQENAVK